MHCVSAIKTPFCLHPAPPHAHTLPSTCCCDFEQLCFYLFVSSVVLHCSAAQRYLTSLYGDEHPSVARAKNTVACVLQRQNHDDEALTIFHQVVSLRRPIVNVCMQKNQSEMADTHKNYRQACVCGCLDLRFDMCLRYVCACVLFNAVQHAVFASIYIQVVVLHRLCCFQISLKGS